MLLFIFILIFFWNKKLFLFFWKKICVRIEEVFAGFTDPQSLAAFVFVAFTDFKGTFLILMGIWVIPRHPCDDTVVIGCVYLPKKLFEPFPTPNEPNDFQAN
jgi:hypothetical protein